MKSFDLLFEKEFRESCDIDNKIVNFLYEGNSEKLWKYLKNKKIKWLDVDGYAILLTISIFTSNDHKHLDNYLKVVKQQEDVKDVKIITNDKYKTFELIIEKEDSIIKVLPFSKVFPTALKVVPTLEKEDLRAGDCFELNSMISRGLGKKNDFVIGYTYGYTDKSKYLHSWVETNLNNEDVVISGRFNAIIPKDAFYALRHAEVINRISNKDLTEDIINYLSKFGTFPDTAYYSFGDEIISDLRKNDEMFKKGK